MGLKKIGGVNMKIKLATGQEYDAVVVEHVIVFHLDRGATDEERGPL